MEGGVVGAALQNLAEGVQGFLGSPQSGIGFPQQVVTLDVIGVQFQRAAEGGDSAFGVVEAHGHSPQGLVRRGYVRREPGGGSERVARVRPTLERLQREAQGKLRFGVVGPGGNYLA